MDAEGSELRILMGGKSVISRFRPRIAMEVHQARIRGSQDSCSCNCCAFVTREKYDVKVTGEYSSVGDVHWVWATPMELAGMNE